MNDLPRLSNPDLFGYTPPPPFGLLVRLINGRQDHHHTDCHDLAEILPGRGPHAAALQCLTCGKHRGWMATAEFEFVSAVVARHGVPNEPIILRAWNIGDKNMATTKQYDNSGILFRNEDKNNERDRDYQGEATIAGVGYWLSAWIKEGKKGKFMTFSFKPKDAAPKTASAAASTPYDDEIPF